LQNKFVIMNLTENQGCGSRLLFWKAGFGSALE
jgi:hypothetical protein